MTFTFPERSSSRKVAISFTKAVLERRFFSPPQAADSQFKLDPRIQRVADFPVGGQQLQGRFQLLRRIGGSQGEGIRSLWTPRIASSLIFERMKRRLVELGEIFDCCSRRPPC